MSLAVEFLKPINDDGTECLESWCVTEPLVVLEGFARKIDAEIAMNYLLTFSNIDYSLCGHAFFQQFGFENRDEMMAEACKRLKW